MNESQIFVAAVKIQPEIETLPYVGVRFSNQKMSWIEMWSIRSNLILLVIRHLMLAVNGLLFALIFLLVVFGNIYYYYCYYHNHHECVYVWVMPEERLKRKRVLVFPGNQELIIRINNCHCLTPRLSQRAEFWPLCAARAPQELSCSGFVSELL